MLVKDRGFLRDLQTEMRTPLEGIDVLVVSSRSGSLGVGLLRWAADAGVAVLVCNEKYIPSGMFLPISGTNAHPTVLAEQIQTSLPCKKRFWASVVRVKVSLQAQALRLFNLDDAGVRKWVKNVRSGDPENREASAALAYFPAMFGPSFRRGDDSPLNHHLNYGYAVARAATARAAVAIGLHPALPIHHSSARNAFALVDDLMEPFRAVVDIAVRLHDCVKDDLNPDCKRAIVAHLGGMLRLEDDRATVIDAMRSISMAWRSALKGGDTECPSIAFDEERWRLNDIETCG